MTVRRLLVSLISLAAIAVVASAQTGPSLTVEESVRDAGIVQTGAKIRQTFVIRNQGDEALRLLSVDPDCGCTVVSFDDVIAPGSTGTIEAEVDVSTFVGPIAKYLNVRTNDPANPQLALTIKAEVRPEILTHPGYARFLTVVGEEELSSEQTVWASEFENFEIRGVRSPYPFLDVEFHEATEKEERSEGQGRQWRIVMTLAKNAPVGPMADHVRLVTNHPEHRTTNIPVSGFVRPLLAVTPPVIDIGKRDGGKPIIASAQVKNFSEDEIVLLSVASELPQVEARIQPDGRDHYLIVTLQPGLTKGAFSTVLTVQTDSSKIPTLEVEIRGTIL